MSTTLDYAPRTPVTGLRWRQHIDLILVVVVAYVLPLANDLLCWQSMCHAAWSRGMGWRVELIYAFDPATREFYYVWMDRVTAWIHFIAPLATTIVVLSLRLVDRRRRVSRGAVALAVAALPLTNGVLWIAFVLAIEMRALP